MKHHWTDEERLLVKNFYGKVPIERLANQIGASTKAINIVASNLHVTRFRTVPHQWTDGEDDIVRREYSQTKESTRRIAQKLGLTVYQVSGRCGVLGLLKRTSRNHWTDGEETLLVKLYEQGKSLIQISKKLGKSTASVRIHANRKLQIKFSERNGWYTKTDVCGILGVDHKWVQARIDAGDIKASWRHGEEPQKNGGSCWEIKEDTLRNFIVNHAWELNGRNVDLVGLVDIIANGKRRRITEVAGVLTDGEGPVSETEQVYASQSYGEADGIPPR